MNLRDEVKKLKYELEKFKSAGRFVLRVQCHIMHTWECYRSAQCRFRKTKDVFVKVQKERDYHKMHHRRVVQEKNRLIEDLKRYYGIVDVL